VVAAGEILEHVTDLPATVAELCRVLRPAGCWCWTRSTTTR
jgi:2-polyprenyl-6-hydroxyphenyl methylase/3-demethylubiquinone-9 3-methyltransferase